jgi:hypothetical protein
MLVAGHKLRPHDCCGRRQPRRRASGGTFSYDEAHTRGIDRRIKASAPDLRVPWLPAPTLAPPAESGGGRVLLSWKGIFMCTADEVAAILAEIARIRRLLAHSDRIAAQAALPVSSSDSVRCDSAKSASDDEADCRPRVFSRFSR